MNNTCGIFFVCLAEARQRTNLPCNFSVLFYAGKYFSSFGSIFPVEDIVGVIPPAQVSNTGEVPIWPNGTLCLWRGDEEVLNLHRDPACVGPRHAGLCNNPLVLSHLHTSSLVMCSLPGRPEGASAPDQALCIDG
jgi:hypothetical protein